MLPLSIPWGEPGVRGAFRKLSTPRLINKTTPTAAGIVRSQFFSSNVNGNW
jgi:hypothetical protein